MESSPHPLSSFVFSFCYIKSKPENKNIITVLWRITWRILISGEKSVENFHQWSSPQNVVHRASNTAQKRKTCTVKPADLSSVPSSHMVGEHWLLQLLSDLHTCAVACAPRAHTDTNLMYVWKSLKAWRRSLKPGCSWCLKGEWYSALALFLYFLLELPLWLFSQSLTSVRVDKGGCTDSIPPGWALMGK